MKSTLNYFISFLHFVGGVCSLPGFLFEHFEKNSDQKNSTFSEKTQAFEKTRQNFSKNSCHRNFLLSKGAEKNLIF